MARSGPLLRPSPHRRLQPHGPDSAPPTTTQSILRHEPASRRQTSLPAISAAAAAAAATATAAATTATAAKAAAKATTISTAAPRRPVPARPVTPEATTIPAAESAAAASTTRSIVGNSHVDRAAIELGFVQPFDRGLRRRVVRQLDEPEAA